MPMGRGRAHHNCPQPGTRPYALDSDSNLLDVSLVKGTAPFSVYHVYPANRGLRNQPEGYVPSWGPQPAAGKPVARRPGAMYGTRKPFAELGNAPAVLQRGFGRAYLLFQGVA